MCVSNVTKFERGTLCVCPWQSFEIMPGPSVLEEPGLSPSRPQRFQSIQTLPACVCSLKLFFPVFNSVQSGCIVESEAQKGLLFFGV